MTTQDARMFAALVVVLFIYVLLFLFHWWATARAKRLVELAVACDPNADRARFEAQFTFLASHGPWISDVSAGLLCATCGLEHEDILANRWYCPGEPADVGLSINEVWIRLEAAKDTP